MECHIIEKKDFTLVRISGPIRRTASFMIRNTINREFRSMEPRIILDMEDISEKEDISQQLAIMNVFKKETDMMNGSLKICSLALKMKAYLVNNRLDRMFDIYETLDSAENSSWKKKGYGEKGQDSGAAA